MNHTNQSGRSMIEMLGVLAIIGVLSVGGIAGYSKAMMKFKINKTIDQISQISQNVRVLYARQKSYRNLSTKIAYKANLAPREIFEGSGSDYGMTNAFGGAIGLYGTNLENRTHDYKAFSLGIDGLPEEACIELATQDWGGINSGLVGIAVDVSSASWGNVYKNCQGQVLSNGAAACSGGGTVPIPMPVDIAVDACVCNSYGCSINFKFY